jgi:hypothetical protein
MRFQTPEGGCMWPHHVDSPILVYDRDSFEKYKSGEYELPKHCICGVALSYEEPVCISLVLDDNLTWEMMMLVKIPKPCASVYLVVKNGEGQTIDVSKHEVEGKAGRMGIIGAEKYADEEAANKAFTNNDWVNTCFVCGGDHAYHECPEMQEAKVELAKKERPFSFSMGCSVRKKLPRTAEPDVTRITIRCEHSGQYLSAMAFDDKIRWSCSCGYFFDCASNMLEYLPDEITVADDCMNKDQHS